jgi:ZIP family zinc transporter/zinc and cadmium transporter
MLAYGTGFVLAIALVELIPAGLEETRSNAVWVLAGFSTLYLIDIWLERTGESFTVANGGFASCIAAVLGVGLCDFFDGFVVASAVETVSGEVVTMGAEADAARGWLLLAGLFPHNFLEGASIALFLLAAGLSRGTAWILALCLGAASLLGGMAVEWIVPRATRAAIQAFAGGLLLHLVASQRIPSFKGEIARAQAALVVAGIATFPATQWLVSFVGIEG